jgi:sigma-E factor negative regulatory protein RseC
MIVKAENLVNARQGDLVEVYLSTAAKMKCLFVIYILPVLGLLTGALSAESLSNRIGLNPDIGMALFALFGFGIALLAVRAFNNRVARAASLTPAVRRVIRRAPQSV